MNSLYQLKADDRPQNILPNDNGNTYSRKNRLQENLSNDTSNTSFRKTTANSKRSRFSRIDNVINRPQTSKLRSLSMSPFPDQRQESYSYDRRHYHNNLSKHKRSKSTSHDLMFVERKHHKKDSSHMYIPSDFEYSGKIKVKCNSKNRRVPCPCPMPPIIPMCEPLPNIVNVQPCYNYQPDYSSCCGQMNSVESYSKYNQENIFEGNAQNHYENSYNPNNYPPIPPGAKIIAQYVDDFDNHQQISSNQQMPVFNQNALSYNQNALSYNQITRKRIDNCLPKSKIIEVWRKQRRSHHKDDLSFDSIKKDIIESIAKEIQKLDKGDRYQPTITHTKERDVKVIVQPIQPVFYMPKQQPQQPLQPQQPVGILTQPAPAPPQIVYVPRNVYVPVIKPVFVPRERIIVRPQIVQVARPVVIDRPIPVTQRPIVIDRERPVPFPVIGPSTNQVRDEQYIYRDNLPLAYGGRTGEFATGMNYGYVPVDENYQYIASGCDDVLRNQLVSQSEHYLQNNHHNRHYENEHYHSGMDCFDEALGETVSNPSAYSEYHPHIPVVRPGPDNTTNINIGESNRTALIETLRRAGTGCANLEVLDSTIKPEWEPVNAKMLIQRYGQNAVRFVESGVSYGYNQNMEEFSDVSKFQFAAPKQSSMDFLPASTGYQKDHFDQNGFHKVSTQSVDKNFGMSSEGSFEDVNQFNHRSTSSLQIGGNDQWTTPNKHRKFGIIR